MITHLRKLEDAGYGVTRTCLPLSIAEYMLSIHPLVLGIGRSSPRRGRWGLTESACHASRGSALRISRPPWMTLKLVQPSLWCPVCEADLSPGGRRGAALRAPSPRPP